MNDHKIALITGANKGIGLEIARQLNMQGIAVFIGVRDENRGREAAATGRKHRRTGRATRCHRSKHH